MVNKPSFGLPLVLLLAAAGAASAQIPAATSASAAVSVSSRLAGDWKSTAASVLPSSAPAQLHTAADLGSASANVKLTRMLLLLAPSAAQKQALNAKLADQQNSSSASYHKWLTPAEYAESFANSASDVAAVVAWLESQGFTVAPLPASRGWIEFSGTSAQVESAFQSKLESYESADGPRVVLSGSISIPAALAPLVEGLVSLDGSLSVPALTVPEAMSLPVTDLASRTSATAAEALTPNLAAQLVGLDTLRAADVTGAGESIAIPARSNLRSADVDAFRSSFGLPAQSVSVVANGADPGLTSDRAAATLAASWAGVAAPGAQIVLVPAATTTATDGVDLALAAIVDGALAHTVAVGYSACEAGMSAPHQAFYEALYKQAAAEGIAIVAATGDSGAAACHVAGSTAPVSTGYAVNALASTPWNTAVGVAAFGATADTSSLKAWSQATAADPEYASGGGSSTVYAVPSWQSAAASGSAQKRLLPDVVLPTALDSGVNRGLAYCLSGAAASDGCTLVRSGGSLAASALFAGVAALVAEKNGAQGSLQSTIYSLASKSGVYSDVAQGKAQLSCTAGTSGCDATGEIGYSAASGYDLATGLGAVNASALVSNWATPMVGSGGTTVGISVSPNQIGTGYNPSTTVTFTATVSSTTGGSTPTGTITFYDNTVSQSLTLPVALSNGTATATLTSGSGLASGDNLIIAQYSGDSSYAATNSSSINVHTQASTTSLVVTPSVTTAAPGQYISATAALTVSTPPAGAVVPSGIVTLYVDGNQSATASISTTSSPYTATFNNVLIPANSTATSHTLLAIYASNTDYVGSTSSQVTIAVAKTTPTVVVTPSTSTPLPNSSLTLTATVAPSSSVSESVVPTGTVSFYQDSVLLGNSSLSAATTGSTATYTLTTSSTTGAHTYYAVYSSDSNYNAATSSTITVTVTKGTPILTLTPSTTTPAGGSTMTLTGTLSQSNSTTIVPTGTVSFSLDGSSFGGATLSSDGKTATYSSFTAPTYGSHTLQATYSGDSEYNSVSSAEVTINVAKIVTTLAVTPSSTSVAAGSTMSANVTITPNSYLSSLPSGTVTLLVDGSTTACTATVNAGSPSTATCSFTAPASGSHTIQATYSGDTYYATSSAYSSSFTTTKTTTTTTVVPATTTPSAGNTLSVTAYVYPSTAQSSLPSGTVTFTLDGVSVGSATVTSGSPATATTSFTVPSAGSHVLGATYGGDTYYSSSTASTVTLTAVKSTPTVTITPSTTAPGAGSSMTLTATVTPPTTGATAATGTVAFSIDGAVVGTSAVNSGTATLATSAPTALGSHTVSATYSGDTNYNSASSSSAGIIVSKVATTLTVTPGSTTPTANANMMVTATLAASTTSTVTASGTVTFTVDGAVVATSTLIGGTTATATITVPATGTHSIQASYSGDSYYQTSTATAVNITVAKTTTSTVVTPSTTTPALNTTLPVTVTVTPTTVNTTMPTGTVTISVDGAAISAQAVTPGNPATVSATLPAMSPGTHTLTAVYSGDTYYATSTSTSATVTVPKVTTATTVTPATNTPSGGSSLSVSASVTPTTTLATLPTGTVSFTIDGVSVSSVAVTSGSPAAANATLSSSSLTPGTHALAAVYSGDTNYAASTSAASTLTISKSSTTTTVVPSTLTPTAGGSMTVSVNVTSANLVTAMPSGIVTLTQDGVAVGTGTLVTGSPSVATITLNIVSAGTHVLEATYAGDTYYTGSNSSTVSIIANRGASTTIVTASPATLTAGTTETLTATLAPATSVTGVTYTLTGTVKFYDKTTLLGTVTVASNTAVLSGVSLKDNVSHSITAIYSGDTNWVGSTSAAVPLDSITLPDYVVLTSNYSKAPPGAAVVLTATVTPTSTSTTTTTANPSGYVDFYMGTTLLGRAALVADTTTGISISSVATLTTQTLPGGQDTIYAYYEGDDTYDAATSNMLTITVQDFTITPSSTNPATNLTIVRGAAGSASFDIAGVGGFNNEVQVICTVPSVDNMTCTASPQQVVPTGTVTFVIQTYKSGSLAEKYLPLLPWSKAAGGTALAVIGFLFLPFGRRVRRFLYERAGKSCTQLLLLFLLLTGLVGAGVGCTSSTTTNPTSSGTPLGVTTIKITATAYVDNTVISHSVYLSVNVVSGS